MIQDKIKSVIELGEQPFDLLPGLVHDHKKKVERIYFYKNNRFVECSDENAIFWNVVSPYIMHFSKNIDGDVKDFRGIGKGDANIYQSWILDVKFKKWADDYNLGIKLDDLTQLVAEFGSYMLKLVKIDGKYDIQFCDLRNLRFDPRVENIKDTDIVELHYLTANDIYAKEEAWDGIDEIIEFNKTALKKGERIEFQEFTGYDDDRNYVHVIGTFAGDRFIECLNEEIKEEDFQYQDFHLEKYSGTWLRPGAYERNFVEQERANTLVNQNAEATAIASLLLLRSQDPNTSGNVLRGAISGQIVNSADLQQIAIDNRAAGVLLNELQIIEAKVRKNLLLPDVATGDELPSGTTFRGQAMMSNAYKSAFKQMRNRILTPMKDLIQDKILPTLVKDWNREELLELTGDEQGIELYDEAVKIKRKIEYALMKDNAGLPVTPDELYQLDQETDQEIERVGRKVELPKKFFNFEYGIVIDPVGETYDKGQQNDALIQAITMEMTNPAVTESPRYRQLLENNGLNQAPLNKQTKNALMQSLMPQQPVPQMNMNSAVDTNV